MNLTKKQKLQMSLIVLFVIILLWQLFQLFHSSEPDIVGLEQSSKESKLNYSSSNKPSVIPINLDQNKQKLDNSFPILNGPEAEYTRLSSELQIVQMQRAIAENYEAIAIAKRNTAKAMSEVSQISGGNFSLSGTNNLNNESLPVSSDYELIYTGQEGGQWTATLKKNNQTFDVVPNTVLGDMKVIRIDDNSVTIAKGKIQKVITFNGTLPINESDDSQTPTKVEKLEISQSKETQKINFPQAALTTQQQIKVSPPQLALPTTTNATLKKSEISENIRNKVTKPINDKNEITSNKKVAFASNNPPIPLNDNKSLSSDEKNQNYYFIQLMATNDQKGIEDFVKKHKLFNQIQILTSKRQGKNWYILAYGKFPTIAAAKNEFENLTDELLRFDPFIRKMNSNEATQLLINQSLSAKEATKERGR
ncbi:MAG: Cell division protein DamX [Legionellaceae bacterium]